MGNIWLNKLVSFLGNLRKGLFTRNEDGEEEERTNDRITLFLYLSLLLYFLKASARACPMGPTRTKRRRRKMQETAQRITPTLKWGWWKPSNFLKI